MQEAATDPGKYTLLTGATGLLGSMLMRDLLVRDTRLAVVVRPTRLETAERRIEQQLSFWENAWGRNLPRPVILCGDLTSPLLGLCSADLAWLRRHCTSILNSAASLTFYEKKGEPWRTNLEGVRNVLELCHDAGIRFLEHVSTAYVCGLRQGRVYESELDVGQEYGNDYEKSKVASEKLIRADKHLKTFTIYRPTIIVGDSQTGYTPTFHGFYSPLRVVSALLGSTSLEEALQVDYVKLLGLDGNERKNFVPVNWVSEAMISIRARMPPRGATYTLASEHPVTVGRMHRVLRNAAEWHRARQLGRSAPSQPSPLQSPSTADASDATEQFERLYVEHFAVYRSYWRDDPDFDCSNTRAALPDLPPSELTDELLHRLCEYALEANFGFPPPKYDPPRFSAGTWLEQRVEMSCQDGPVGDASTLGLRVTGSGGGEWTIYCTDSRDWTCTRGIVDTNDVIRISMDTLRELASGECDLKDALRRAAVVAFGNPTKTRNLFERLLFQRVKSRDG